MLQAGHIVAPEAISARSNAAAIADLDAPWSAAIVRRMQKEIGQSSFLPRLAEIEANAHAGAITVSMLAGWRVAADAGIIPPAECNRLTELQLATVDRELVLARCTADARGTLQEMRAEYRQFLDGARGGATAQIAAAQA